MLHQKYAHVTEITELVPLALQIARFKLVAHARKSARRGENRSVDITDEPIPDHNVNIILEIEQRELLDQLHSCLPKLGERCREIFRLKLEGQSFPEIQLALGASSINTVYTWEARCREDLKLLMSQARRPQ